ncbi:MAG: hypothetical protein ABL903_00210 [Methylococcales bacterium]
MAILVNLKRLSNPRVRRRLKIGLSVWAGVMLLGVSYKLVYDVGYFDAHALKNEKLAALPVTQSTLTMDSAQRIVTAALQEEVSNPKTIVTQIIDDNPKLSTIMIEHNQQKKVAWIVDMRLFFVADVFNNEGYNLTKGYEQHYGVN